MTTQSLRIHSDGGENALEFRQANTRPVYEEQAIRLESDTDGNALKLYGGEAIVVEGEGLAGDPGMTAYQLAVFNGFQGTEIQWLASLKGEEGDQGPQGPQGAPGNDLLSGIVDGGNY